MKKLLIIGMMAMLLLPIVAYAHREEGMQICTERSIKISPEDQAKNAQILEAANWRLEKYSEGRMQGFCMDWWSHLFRQHWDYVDEIFASEQGFDHNHDYVQVDKTDIVEHGKPSSGNICHEARVDQGIHTCA